MSFNHIPVLLNEIVTCFQENQVGRFIDGTLGGAGHSFAILNALPQSQLLGIDQDPTAIQAATQKLACFGNRVHIHRGNFSQMAEIAQAHQWDNVTGILLDLGVSSPQIDTPERGFSFRYDAPLDMRMNPDASVTAAQILNTYSEKELSDIFFNYGEERKSRQVAKAVVKRREQTPWQTTGELAELLESVIGRANQHGLPPATRCFQALRIAVNDELNVLKKGLKEAIDLLSPGGILAVISFHSLEDRIVKQTFTYESLQCICPPDFPVCRCNKIQTLELLTHKPIRPSEQEQANNPRACCSKLRIAKKTNTIKNRGRENE